MVRGIGPWRRTPRHPADPRTAAGRRFRRSRQVLARLDDLFGSPGWNSACRIETRSQYASDTDDPRWAEWQREGRVVVDDSRPWYVLIRRLVAEGRTVRRVRVIDAPPTAGQEYLRATAHGNRRAGEQIRELSREAADTLDLHADTWLFDGAEPVVATLLFDDDDVLTDVALARDQAAVVEARTRFATAWAAASTDAAP